MKSRKSLAALFAAAVAALPAAAFGNFGYAADDEKEAPADTLGFEFKDVTLVPTTSVKDQN